MWHWVASVRAFGTNILPISSLVGPTAQRTGALKSMLLIGEPIQDETHFGRKEVLASWFASDTDSSTRKAALAYLGEWGRPIDVSYIKEELEKNDTQTINAAADAIVRIVMRDDRRGALVALYELQPSSVKPQLLDELFVRDVEFDDEALVQGATQRSATVRRRVVEVLLRRSRLPSDLAERLLGDDDADVRYLALQGLVASGRSFSLAEAKAVLVRQKETSGGFFRYTTYVESEGEANYEHFVLRSFDRVPTGELEENEIGTYLDQRAYLTLARREFRSRGDKLRRDVANRFVDRYEVLMGMLTTRFAGETTLIEEARSLGNHLRRSFTREGLDIICGQLDPADLPLVRSTLVDVSLYFSTLELQYIAKFGQWSDVPLVIASTARSTYRRTQTLLLSGEPDSKYRDAALALCSLAKDRVKDLVATSMPSNLLVEVLKWLPHKTFRRLTDADIEPLLRSESDEVRRIAAIRYVHAFPRSRAKTLLHRYLDSTSYFYNVTYWLDFGASVPRDMAVAAAKRTLAELKSN